LTTEQEFKQLAINEAAYYGNAIVRYRNNLQTMQRSGVVADD
jgi:hypothetical protein